MLVLKAEGLKKGWNGEQVFENANIEIYHGERVALIGKNGAGKTTFLNCLSGQVSPNEGKIFRRFPVKEWGIIEQNLTVKETLTLTEFVQSGHSVLYSLKRELNLLENVMGYEKGNKLNNAVENYSTAIERYQALGGYEWEYEVKTILNRFALSENNIYNELSGGQKTKAQLARVLVGNPSFLLLDEPTNHLDIETMDWLISWLKTFNGTVLFVSHDREFIDRVANKTVELESKGTKTYQGGYSDFLREREREQRQQEALYKKQLQKKKKLEEAINRYREWFLKAHQAAGERNPFYKKKAEKNRSRFQAKEKALERLNKEQVERPENNFNIYSSIKESAFEARHLVQMENVEFSYGNKRVLQQINFTISRGDRLAVTGVNGSGKTTLLKLLSGELQPTNGSVINHPKLKIGYFAQELDSLCNEDTIMNTVLRLPEMTQRDARNILANFFFRKDDVFRKINTLSMGERCRVAFVLLYYSEANLLVLDEPTNYLDIATREIIEKSLYYYPGAMVIVSHDRYLLKKVSNRVIVLNNGTMKYYPGTYEEYQNYLRKRSNQHFNSETQDQILALQLKLAQLMAEEEPEGEGDRKAFYNSIDKIKKKIEQLKK